MCRFHERAQLSAELALVIGLLIVLFILVMGVVLDALRGLPTQEHLQAAVLANKVAQTIDALATASPGTQAVIDLPGGNYSLKVFPQVHAVSVFWKQEEIAASLQTSLVQGTLLWAPGSEITIKKEDTYVTLQ